MKTIITNQFHPSINKWSGLCVIMGLKGTHEDYHIVYNGECNSEYFDTEKEANDRAETEYACHLLDSF